MTRKTSKAFESKRRTRRQLQALPFEEKLLILERLREDLIIGLAGERNKGDGSSRARQDKSAPLLINAIKETIGGQPQQRRSQWLAESQSALEMEIKATLADRERVAALVRALFPIGLPLTVEFFERLNDLQMRLGWNEASASLAGAFLSSAIEQLDSEKGETLLAALPRVGNPGFFQTLDCLGSLLRCRELRPQFAADWFPSLVKRIGNDLASGGFWKALEAYCEHHPRTAVEVLRCLEAARDEKQILVAAYVLGTLRSLNANSDLQNVLDAIELEFSRAATPTPRAVYNRSWIQTAWRGTMKKADLQALISRISAGAIEEGEQAFGIVCRSLLSPSIPPDCFDFGMAWLRANASSSLSPTAMYHVIDFAAQFRSESTSDASELILSVQPVLPKHKGIWQRIEHFFVELLRRDLAAFTNFLLAFARANAANWLKVLNTGREFEWLLSEMRGREVAGAVGQLVFDETAPCRKLGLFLFDELDLNTLPDELLVRLEERRLALAFYESQRTPLHAAANARFLILLISPIERMSSALQREFHNELALQLQNYPGGCRDEFQRRSTEFPVLRKAIDEGEAYFERLTRVKESGIAGMAVAGARQALNLNARRFARAVEKGAEQMSVFMKLFSKVRLLYGNQWSVFHEGTLGDRSSLQQFSSSMEVPRMEFIDPEGMSLRRYQASVKIRELSNTTEAETDG
ncbi:MAG TPA: hypothetical protein P5186_02695 [Candidatus Paceibacterota bacterium]|nr:hypothetical protein [Verrucomicrobiota bacterium]HRY46932.1 hypothetical protein [Candidatus Paceibacterota bacterium]